jgi:cation diffusion facilitator CzcD-associated flavoprotein CzcO
VAADDILFVPALPETFIEAAYRGKSILFVGAGASRLAVCPGWAELADGAVRDLVRQGKFSYAQAAQIEHLNPRLKPFDS